jgi:hypothetical protein
LVKLVEAGGTVLMVGAPLDTVTLLHHAEHLAYIPNKRLRRYEVPLAAPVGVEGRMIKEFDTSVPVVPASCCDLFVSAPLLISNHNPSLGALLELDGPAVIWANAVRNT